MSNLTNDIRRARAKLKIFEMEGSGQLMMELIQFAGDYSDDADVRMIIQHYRAKLGRELVELEEKQDKYKQGKIDFS